MVAMTYALENCRILVADGCVTRAAVTVVDGCIVAVDEIRPSQVRRFDAEGLLLLSGIVDVHGDAFERQVMPRPDVTFPLDVALIDTDRQMTANGITTGFHGITYSWEPGLRSGATAKRIIGAIRQMRPRLGCSLRVHLRFEAHAVDGVGDVIGMIGDGLVDALAFNDHVPHMRRHLGQPAKIQETAARTGLSVTDFADLLERVHARAAEVPEALCRLAACAGSEGIALLSHDDDTPAARCAFHDQGSRISEFPVDAATARTARELGDDVVLGAPNILRGASHCGRLPAAEAIAEGLCTILASDYYYPALLHAPFRLAAMGLATFPAAWNLVSRTPARAMGLADRGEIAPGQRADMILVDDRVAGVPRVAATIVAGRPVFLDGSILGDWANGTKSRPM